MTSAFNSLFAYIERLESQINELERRQNNMFREGEIAEVDYEKGTAILKDGDVESPAASWLTRAGAVRDWNPVTVGERAILFSPTGDLERAFILPGGFSEKFQQNHNEGGQPRRTIGAYSITESAEGLKIEVGGTTLTVTASGMQLEAGGVSFKLTGEGFVQEGGAQMHDEKNVGSSHVHGGIRRGDSLTDPPA